MCCAMNTNASRTMCCGASCVTTYRPWRRPAARSWRGNKPLRGKAAPLGSGAAFQELFGGGESRRLRRGEHGGGFLGDARALKEFRVLRAPQPHRIRESEVAKIVGGDVAVLDQLVGLGQGVPHVDHVEMPDVRAEDRIEL